VTHVAVLGAGPAGLGAAYLLARAGHDVTVLERGAGVGGLAASFEVAGQRVDHGSHRLHTSTAPAVLATLRELLGDDLQERRRHGRIRLSGTYVEFPPSVPDLVKRLPPTMSVRLVADTLTTPLRRPRDDTFAEAIRASLGPTLARAFYEPYVRKIWGLSGSELSDELARRRVGSRSTVDLVRRTIDRTREPTFFYPRLGFGQIVDALADAATDAGADIRTGADVTGVHTDAGGAEIHLSSGEVVEADQAWSTLPLPVLARLAAAPAYAADAADRLDYRALALVYVALGQAQWTPFDAHYFPEPEVAMSRISEPKNYRESVDDPRDMTVLCAEVPCSQDDELWSADDRSLGRLVADDIARVGLPEIEPAEVVVRRVPRAYPVYRVGYEEAFEHLDGWVARRPNLLTFGRQGLFVHDNTHHALAMAWAAVDALRADGRIDPGSWAAARDRFRDHVVAD
jgi:protoporphyrinogen oxidase